jgi:hypothetical protein
LLPNSLDYVDIIENTFIYVLLFTLSYICTLSMLHRIKMPETYVVHLGNSKELMEVAEDSVAKRILREHVRESLGVRNEDLIFAIINSMLSLLMR